MKNAALIVKISGEDIRDIVKNAVSILQKHNINPLVEKKAVKRFGLDLPARTIDEMRILADFVVVLGGDGTLLYTSRIFKLLEIPIIAFNLGHLGFIIEFDINDFERVISDALKNKIILKDRMKLTASVYQDDERVFEEEALNEVVINKGAPYRMLELRMYIDGAFVAKYRSDGLIVSTPIGSTGYTVSAGGPIVHPEMDTMIISPICPHSLNIRPIVIPYTSSVEIKIDNPNSESFITFDGQVVIPFYHNNRIIIKKSPVYAKIAVKENVNYYSKLRDKLGWGGDIC